MEASKGLSGVVVADTALSFVDGQTGTLIYRGYDIQDLGDKASYEEVVYLLWNGYLPNEKQLGAFKAALSSKRMLPASIQRILEAVPPEAHPVAVLRSVVSWLGLTDVHADDIDASSVRSKALLLTAMFPTIIAALERIRSGKEPVEPQRELDHAENFLYMLTGAVPDSAAARALDAYLVLLADHGFNASTFAARVTVSTQADVYSGITSGIGTLKGAAHGGANQKAMEQFIEAAQHGDVAAWYEQARKAGRRIMGIGHRVYKVEDPRAKILRPLAKQLALDSGQGEWFEIAAVIEKLAREDAFFVDRRLFANVDYYSAVVLYMLQIPIDQFTNLFAMSRIAGWTAHIMEQLTDNRLIRPRANYIGPKDLPFVSLENRS